jgi:hypothetical protein
MRTPPAAERAEQVDECLRSQQTRGEDFNCIAVCLVERFGWDESTAALEAFKWSVPR